MRAAAYVLLLAACLSGGEDPTGLVPLRAYRDQRLAELIAREQADAAVEPPLDFSLRCEGLLHLASSLARAGKDGHAWEDATIRLARRGGRWYVQGIEGISRELWDRFDLRRIDASGLAWSSATGLTGSLVLTAATRSPRWDLGLEIRDHQAGHRGYTVASQWDLGGRWRIEPHSTTIAITCPAPTRRRSVRMEIPDALQGPVVGEPRPLRLDLVWTGSRFLPAMASAPTWNLALHPVDASGLELEADRLHGRLVIACQRDPFVPKGELPAPQSFAFAVSPLASRFAVAGRSQGGFGDYPCQVRGSVGLVADGSYRSEDRSGTRTNRLTLAVSAPPMSRSLPEPDPSWPVPRQVALLQRQSLALDLALGAYPLPWDAALEQVWSFDPAVENGAAWPAARAAQTAAPTCVAALGTVATADPDFGPYALPTKPWASPLATQTGWLHPPRWKVSGPYPAPRDAEAALPWPGDHAAGIELPCTDDGLLRCLPPKAGADQAWYATTEVACPDTRELFLAMRGQVVAWLWLDGRLIWRSGYRWTGVDTAVLPVRLAPGTHRFSALIAPRTPRLLPASVERDEFFFAYGNELPPDGLALHLRVGVAPRPAETIARQEAAERLAGAALRSASGLGWRGDGTGRHPDADPPLGWDADRRINVAWTAEIPVSHGDPVVAEGALYVAGEPHHLHCLDAATGALRWTAAADVLAFDPALRQRWIGKGEALWQRLTRRSGLEQEADRLRAALATRDEDAGPPLPAKERARLEARLRELEVQVLVSDADWTAFAGDLKERGLVLDRASGTVGSATPVVRDGLAYIHFGTGLAMAVAADGTVRWRVDTGLTWLRVKAAPIFLVGDSLIVHGLDRKGMRIGAFRISDGKPLWQSPHLPGESLIPLRLAGPTGTRDVLLTSAGQVLASADGTLLARAPVAFPAWDGTLPASEGGRVYVTPARLAAGLHAFLDEAGRVAMRPLWRQARGWWTKPVNGEAPLVLDGTVVALRFTGEHHDHQPVPWNCLHGYDAATGQQVLNVPGVQREVEDPATLSLAGTRLIATDAGARIWGKPVLERLAQAPWNTSPRTIAVGAFPRSRANPAFSGKRMFLAGEGRVLALERSGEDGAALEVQALAQTLLDSIPPRPVDQSATPLVIAAVEQDYPPEAAMDPFYEGRTPVIWLAAGPLPLAAGDPLASIADPRTFIARPGATLELGGTRHVFAALQPPVLLVRPHPVQANGKRYSLSASISMGELMQHQPQRSALLATTLVVDQPRLVHYRCRTPQTTLVLSGQRVDPDQLVLLQPGCHPLLLAVTMQRAPPRVKAILEPCFVRAEPPGRALADWLALVARHRSDLERIAADRSQPARSLRARTILEQLERR